MNFCLPRALENANRLYPAEPVGGHDQAGAIARAIVMNPRYLFCDESNSGLDPQTSIVIDNLIHEITHEYGMTTIIQHARHELRDGNWREDRLYPRRPQVVGGGARRSSMRRTAN